MRDEPKEIPHLAFTRTLTVFCLSQKVTPQIFGETIGSFSLHLDVKFLRIPTETVRPYGTLVSCRKAAVIVMLARFVLAGLRRGTCDAREVRPSPTGRTGM